MLPQNLRSREGHTSYDDEGHLLSADTNNYRDPAYTTDYVNDNNNPTGYSQILEQWKSTDVSGPSVTYVLGNRVIAQNAAGTVSYLMPDGHGSTRQLTRYSSDSTNGQVTARYEYDAFGNQIRFTSTHTLNVDGTIVLYVGEPLDAGTNYYRIGAREYAPDTARFIRADTMIVAVGDVLDANLYVYAGNDPVDNIDPTGNFSLPEEVVVSGMLALLATLTLKSGVDGIRYSMRAATATTWQQRTLLNEYAALNALSFVSGFDGLTAPPTSSPGLVFVGSDVGNAAASATEAILAAPLELFSIKSNNITDNSENAPRASAGSYPPKPGGNGLYPKSWRDAVNLIKNAKGHGNNVRVATLLEAKTLLKEARPDLYNHYYDEAHTGYNYGWEIHDVEKNVGNMLPHIKWYDNRNGYADGHIFFEKP